jgi:cytochrome c-type biogenesis protein CcmH/NrfG
MSQNADPTRRGSAASPLGRGQIGALVAILGFALAAKLAHLVIVHNHYLLDPHGGMDPEYYFSFALRVLYGDLPAGNEVFFISPFYIYFLAGVFWLLGTKLLAAYAVQVGLGTAAVGLMFLAGREAFGVRAGLLAAALTALDGILTFYEVTLLPEAVAPFLTALLLWLLTRADSRRSAPAWLGAGIALGLLGLTRPNSLLFAPLGLLFALRPFRFRSWRAAGAFTLGAALVVLPVTLRNYMMGHDLVLISSQGGLNFYIGNGPEASGTYHAPPGVSASISGQEKDTRRVAEAALKRTLKPSEVSEYYYQLAEAQIRRVPGQWLELMFWKTLFLCNGAEVGLNMSYAYFRDEISWPLQVLWAGFGVIFPLGVLGLGLARRTGNSSGIISAFLGAYAVSVILFFVADRYRIPLHLPLLLFAGLALDRWLLFLERRAWLPAVVSLLLVLGLGALSHRDLGLEQGMDLARTDAALYLIEHYRYAEAEVEILKLSPLGRENWDIQLKLGKAFLVRNQFKEALLALQAAVKSNPDLAEAHELLAAIYLQQLEYEQALPHLRACYSLKPDDLTNAMTLAALYSKLNRDQEAIEIFRRLVALHPEQAELHYFLGALLISHGPRQEAVHELERAVELGPDEKRFREALERARAKGPAGAPGR